MDASERVAVAAREAKAPILVYFSAIKALCDEQDDRLLMEQALSRSASRYGRSKLWLERALAKALSGSSTRLAIVPNPVMNAPGKAGGVHRLLKLADMSRPSPLGRLTNRRSLLAGAQSRGSPECDRPRPSADRRPCRARQSWLTRYRWCRCGRAPALRLAGAVRRAFPPAPFNCTPVKSKAYLVETAVAYAARRGRHGISAKVLHRG
jgi:hypothetical protein